MAKRYQHTQFGYIIIVILVTVVFGLVGLMIVNGINEMALVSLSILVVCLGLFTTLSVVIDDEILKIRFGPGIIYKKFILKDIESCTIVKNHWYYGWGIRYTPYGWLYNVSGFYAVEITLKNGKKYRIGTDAPNDLEKAIQTAIRADSGAVEK